MGVLEKLRIRFPEGVLFVLGPKNFILLFNFFPTSGDFTPLLPSLLCFRLSSLCPQPLALRAPPHVQPLAFGFRPSVPQPLALRAPPTFSPWPSAFVPLSSAFGPPLSALRAPGLMQRFGCWSHFSRMAPLAIPGHSCASRSPVFRVIPACAGMTRYTIRRKCYLFSKKP